MLKFISILPTMESTSDTYAEINSAERREPLELNSISAFGEIFLDLDTKSLSIGILALPVIRFLSIFEEKFSNISFLFLYNPSPLTVPSGSLPQNAFCIFPLR